MDTNTVTASGIRMKLLTRTISVVLENGGTMMTNREKVVNGLEYHLKELSMGKICYECPYFGDDPCEIQLIANALELLKEQEPVEPKIGHGIDDDTWYYGCGACSKVIDYKDRFCRHCGRMVKWG